MLIFTSLCAQAQDRIWVETGINGPVGYRAGLNVLSSDIDHLVPYLKPGAAVGYEHRLIPHLFIGGRLSFDNYSFIYQHEQISGLYSIFSGQPLTTAYTQATVNSNYLSAAPLVDVGLGRRGIVHLFVMPGVSILLHGDMKTEINNGRGYDTVYNSSSSLSKFFFVWATGFRNSFPWVKTGRSC